MTGIHDLPLFVLAGLLLNVTPGPDLAYISARAIAGGFRDGAAATLGITAGCLLHTLAAAAGLSVLLATSAAAFTVVKLVGAGYLAYLGIRMLAGAVSAPDLLPTAAAAAGAAPFSRIVREGLLINVFNPKVALFFLAFLPQFIAADTPAKALSFVLLGCIFNVNSLLVNLPVAWTAARAGAGLRAGRRGGRVLRGVLGALFIGLAGRLALLERA